MNNQTNNTMTFSDMVKNQTFSLEEAINCYKIILKNLEKEDKEHSELLDLLMENIEYDFFQSNTEEKCAFTNWKKAKNRVIFSKKFVYLFPDHVIATWIAYGCLEMLLSCTEDGKTGYVQVFSWCKNEFWIICEPEGIFFILPEEY